MKRKRAPEVEAAQLPTHRALLQVRGAYTTLVAAAVKKADLLSGSTRVHRAVSGVPVALHTQLRACAGPTHVDADLSALSELRIARRVQVGADPAAVFSEDLAAYVAGEVARSGADATASQALPFFAFLANACAGPTVTDGEVAEYRKWLGRLRPRTELTCLPASSSSSAGTGGADRE